MEEVYVQSELEVEIEAFKALKQSDLSFSRKKKFGVVSGKFESLVYWANPSVEKKFPRHSSIARSFFAARGQKTQAKEHLATLHDSCPIYGRIWIRRRFRLQYLIIQQKSIIKLKQKKFGRNTNQKTVAEAGSKKTSSWD